MYPKQGKQRAGVPAMVFSISIIGVAILAFTFGVGLQSSGKFSDLGPKQETKNSNNLPADIAKLKFCTIHWKKILMANWKKLIYLKA